MSKIVWNFSKFMDPRYSSMHNLIVLNREILAPKTFEILFRHARYTICADGGANRLYQAFGPSTSTTTTTTSTTFIPTKIIGDLDSILTSTHDFYASHGVAVEKIKCQDTTDLEKCLQDNLLRDCNLPIVIYGAIGGRFDQTISCINAALKYSKLQNKQIYLVDTDNLVIPLFPGENSVILSSTHISPLSTQISEMYGPSCGIIPFDGVSFVKSTGLKWNLDEDIPLQFGKMVSTSNILISHAPSIHVMSGKVCFTVETNFK